MATFPSRLVLLSVLLLIYLCSTQKRFVSPITTKKFHTSYKTDESTTDNSGFLNVYPPRNATGHCASLRLRGISHDFSVQEALSSSQKIPRRVGLEFSERPFLGPKAFFSLSKGSFHFFHFLEFLVIGFSELHRLQAEAAYLYVPLHTQAELCGGTKRLNCFIIDLLFQNTSQVFGLEANDDFLQNQQPDYRGITPKRPQEQQQAVNFSSVHRNQLQEAADAILVIDRKFCTMAEQRYRLNKIWLPYIPDFPRQAWNMAIRQGLGQNADPPVNSKVLRVGYIDRQDTPRRLPPVFHEWLVSFLTEHASVDFIHLHMQDYGPLEQVSQAASLQVLLGGHGNGLSHQLWMTPGSYVMEFFWSMPFQFDYSTMSQLLKHEYQVLFDGKPLEPVYNASLRDLPILPPNHEDMPNRVVEAQGHLRQFIDRAISSWKNRPQ